jgi:hypothetical protein
MGFHKDMIDNLLAHHKISDSNEGVDMLMKGPTGWTHNFIIGRMNKHACLICGERDTEHVNIR